jgi:5-methylcytosine-specific restriction endonuclease McrA
MSCSVFGHICPVVFVNEAFTETSESRRSGRYLPFKTKVRVVRRDNYTCQHCGKHLLDNEVEFDHRIPISRGGSSDEHNLRLTCHDCNQDKSDRVEI